MSVVCLTQGPQPREKLGRHLRLVCDPDGVGLGGVQEVVREFGGELRERLLDLVEPLLLVSLHHISGLNIHTNIYIYTHI